MQVVIFSTYVRVGNGWCFVHALRGIDSIGRYATLRNYYVIISQALSHTYYHILLMMRYLSVTNRVCGDPPTAFLTWSIRRGIYSIIIKCLTLTISSTTRVNGQNVPSLELFVADAIRNVIALS